MPFSETCGQVTKVFTCGPMSQSHLVPFIHLFPPSWDQSLVNTLPFMAHLLQVQFSVVDYVTYTNKHIERLLTVITYTLTYQVGSALLECCASLPQTVLMFGSVVSKSTPCMAVTHSAPPALFGCNYSLTYVALTHTQSAVGQCP